MSLYLSDMVSLRVLVQKYAITEVSDRKKEEEIKKEIENELKNYTYITNITGISVKKIQDNLEIEVNFELNNTFLNFKIKDSFNVEMFCENNREYIVKAKNIIDSVKNMGGVIYWK